MNTESVAPMAEGDRAPFEVLKQRMMTLGFRWQNANDPNGFRLGLFYKRVPTSRPCLTNDLNQIVVDVYDFGALHASGPAPARFSLTVQLTGEYTPKLWTKLQVYGLTPDDFFARQDDIEAALVRAWESL